MLTGKVLEVIPNDGLRFLRVDCGNEILTALDAVNAGVGEFVVVSCGECAARLSQEIPVDAAVIAKYGKKC